VVHGVLAGHGAHTAPVEPHAPVDVPATQVPPVAAEQQPPLHGWFELHAVVHLFVEVSQACPDGQSAALVQPHTFVARQTWPLTLVAQFWHWLPTVPQVPLAVPGLQTPFDGAVQQPLAHVDVDEQELMHRLPVHALDVAGQSVPTLLQPHCPPPVIGTHR
jgi:hypothetical protein